MATQEPTLVEQILTLGTRAFEPTSKSDTARVKFDNFIVATPTLALIPALNALISPGRETVPEWLRCELMNVLTHLPLRQDGVRATMEFVFSVHPSSTVTKSEASAAQSRGAFITVESLRIAARLIGTVPQGHDVASWFSSIAPQLFHLLEGAEGSELVRAAAYIIGAGILGRKEYGSVGSSGFNVFAHPLLKSLNPSLPDPVSWVKGKEEKEEIVDLRPDAALVSASQLSLSLKRLHTLAHAYSHPALVRRLLRPVLLSLWCLASWPGFLDKPVKALCLQARDLLSIYLRLHASGAEIREVMRNLLFNGNRQAGRLTWKFSPSSNGQLHIIKAPSKDSLSQDLFNGASMEDLDFKSTSFIRILDEASSRDEVSALFLDLFKQWFSASRVQPQRNSTILVIEEVRSPDPLIQLLETKVLQGLLEQAPNKLIGHPDQILNLVKEVLEDRQTLVESDGPGGIALSLLNFLVTTDGFNKSKIEPAIIDSITTSLMHIAETNSEIASTARNLGYLLQNWSEIEAELQPLPSASQQELEDRKIYNVAIQYITSTDAPAPVRSEGLNMLSKLIVSRSSILDVPATLSLLSSLLQDEDDFINLRIIKMFCQMANHHPSSTIQDIIDHYVDVHERASVDTRLRFGEALVQVIERLGETFAENLSKKTCETLLAIAGRRPRRERTKKRQENEAQLAEMKRKKLSAAWGGLPPELDNEEDQNITEDEKLRNEILDRIVSGWDSKRGDEDIRIRASALSILGVGIEANIAGIGPQLVTAIVDLSMNILTMESEIEKGILRRSAVFVILSFIRALEKAREARKRLIFDLTEYSKAKIKRTLEYVSVIDNDGLVQQHAKDAIEILDNWKLQTLIPNAPNQPEQTVFTKLAGLSINTNSRVRLGGNEPRLKIEEIE